MQSRMTIFIGLTLYLIFANIFTYAIVSTVIKAQIEQQTTTYTVTPQQIANYNIKESTYAESLEEAKASSSFRATMKMIGGLILFNFSDIIGVSIIVFIFITIPLILWVLVGLSFIIPLTNPGA